MFMRVIPNEINPNTKSEAEVKVYNWLKKRENLLEFVHQKQKRLCLISL